MDKTNNELSDKKKKFVEFLEKASNQNSSSSDNQQIKEMHEEKEETKDIKETKETKEVIHLNSLITKNISLFTKNPNYKLLAWLVVQLTILSLFILTATLLKNNLVPYINSL